VKDSDDVILSSTRLYVFCDPVQRREWLDVLIALIEYLRSGESHVGFLNNSVDKNMLHKDQQEHLGEGSIRKAHPRREETFSTAGKTLMALLMIEERTVAVRRFSRKRQAENDVEAVRNVRNRKR